MRHRTVCFRSSSQRLPDVLFGRLFPGRLPPRLLNAAAPGGLKPTPEVESGRPSPIFGTALQVFTYIRDTPQYSILIRSRRRLEKTNRWPANASSSVDCVTRACRPSKLFRISQADAHRYTRTLAGRCIMQVPGER